MWQVAAQGGWVSAAAAWRSGSRSSRRFAMGTRRPWWALEGVAGPYGPDRPRRLVIATTDPATLPEAATWYLATTLPMSAADLAEIVRLYGLRNWVEQAVQARQRPPWAGASIRCGADRRHAPALGAGAVRLCLLLVGQTRTPRRDRRSGPRPAAPGGHERGGKGSAAAGVPLAPALALLARGAAAGAGLAGAGLVPLALLAGLVGPAASPVLQALLDWLRAGHPLPLYDSS